MGSHFLFSSVIGKVLLHSVHNSCDHLDSVQQIIIHALPGLDPAQLVQHSGQLIPQRFIDPGVTLDHHIPAKQSSDDVILFSQAGELHQCFQMEVFLR